MAPKSPQRPRSSNHGSPRTENDKEKEAKDRKRVCKACDRCRMKKSKCDGQVPCDRCQADDSMCLYGQRKKTVERVWPKGYTDQLQADFNIVVKGAHKLYSHLSESKGDLPFPRVQKRGSNEKVLLHDILKAIGLLELPAQDEEEEMFSEDPVKLLRKFEEKEEIERRVVAAVQQRVGTPSERDLPMLDARSAPMSRSTSFGSMHAPPYPSMGIPPPHCRHMSLHEHHPAGPRPQYIISGPQVYGTPGGTLPITPAESPSEENFPTQFTGSLQKYFDEFKPPKTSYTNPQLSMSHQLQPNIPVWMNQVPNPFGRTRPSFNQARVATPMIPAQNPPLTMQMPIQQVPPTATGPEAAFSTSSFNEPMLATSNSGTQFAAEGSAWNSPTAALNSGNDPLMGADWDEFDDLFHRT